MHHGRLRSNGATLMGCAQDRQASDGLQPARLRRQPSQSVHDADSAYGEGQDDCLPLSARLPR
jgi:hypothetical protein